MLYDGREYRPNRHLGWRKAQDHKFVDDETDVYADGGFTTVEGQPIEGNNVVLFRIKDADKVAVVMNGRDYMCYDQSTVPPTKCIPICAHTATNMAIGPPKVKTGVGESRFNIGKHRGEIIMAGQKYVEQAHYLVFDGKVFQWSSRRMVKPEDLVT